MPYQPTWNNPYIPQVQGPAFSSVNQLQQYQQYQVPVNGITKVNGRDSAMQYQLPPNSMSPALFDNNGSLFYIVSTDGTGMKTVETFDFTPHVEQQVQVDDSRFVSRREFDELSARVSVILGALNGIHGPVQQQSATDGNEDTNGHAQTDDARGLSADYQ